MKKSIIVMMVAVLLISALFVSCKQEIATPEDRLGTVSIALPSSRDLTPGTPSSIIPEVSSWYYVATKVSGYYHSGQTEWASLDKMQEGQQVGNTFSAGDWKFSFYGFNSTATKDDKTSAIYYAEDIELTVVAKEEPNYIDVVLQGGAIDFGKVTFDNLYFRSMDEDHKLPISGLTLLIDGTEVITTLPYEITLAAEGERKFTVLLKSGEETVGSEEVTITVSKGYNYSISGIIDGLDSVGIVVINSVDYLKTASDSKSVTSGDAVSFKTAVAPDGVETTVEFDSQSGLSGDLKLETTVSGSDAAGAFVISAGSSVASIDLTLTSGSSAKTFLTPATVTTKIATGLHNVSVVYNGTGDAPTDVSYNETTGELSFKTTHFSQFVVVSSDAIIVSDGTAYKTLGDFAAAVNAGNSFAGKTVTLMKDVTLTGTWTPIGTAHRKDSNPTKVFSGTFDGKGHTISGLSSVGYTPAPSTVDLSEYTYGLFGYVKNGTVRNVTLTGVAISQSTYQLENAGGVVGYLDGGTVVNCSVSGTVSGNNGIGGVVGRAYGTCTIENCVNRAAITGKKNVAGVVGFVNPLASGTIRVLNCTNYGNVSRVSGEPAEAGAAAGIACYGCSDSSDVKHATSNLYIAGNVCDANAQITNVTEGRVDRINFLTSHGPKTTTGNVSVQ